MWARERNYPEAFGVAQSRETKSRLDVARTICKRRKNGGDSKRSWAQGRIFGASIVRED